MIPRILLVLFSLSVLAGCATEKPPEKTDLLGYWLCERDSSSLEFTPSGLLLKLRRNPDDIESFLYELSEDGKSLKGKAFTLGWLDESLKRSLLQPQVEWNFRLEGDRLWVQFDDQVVPFRRISELRSLPNAEESGLWVERQSADDGQEIASFLEFTPWGSLILLDRFPAPPQVKSEHFESLCFAARYDYEIDRRRLRLNGLNKSLDLRERKLPFGVSDRVLTLGTGKGSRSFVKTELLE